MISFICLVVGTGLILAGGYMLGLCKAAAMADRKIASLQRSMAPTHLEPGWDNGVNAKEQRREGAKL